MSTWQPLSEFRPIPLGQQVVARWKDEPKGAEVSLFGYNRLTDDEPMVGVQVGFGGRASMFWLYASDVDIKVA